MVLNWNTIYISSDFFKLMYKEDYKVLSLKPREKTGKQ